MSRILVVDDEPSVLTAFREILAAGGHEVVTASRAEAALERLEAEPYELVILDICMPGMDGLDALQRIKQRQPRLPVIVMTGYGTMETAVEATKRGAFDYQLKPLEPAEMLGTIDRALECARLMTGYVALDPETVPPTREAMIGSSSGMQQVYKAIGRVAQTDATVLICGESGTGKELVARAVYHHSLRSQQPLLVVNCVAIPETLLESELFGYEPGAFTGASARRIGKFEQAHTGTIFLDEIGDISLAIQAKILRVLQEKSFERLGSNETIRVDVRVLTATNRNLEKAIAEGSFREDLYHRLNVVAIHLPPLRERREDIPRLVDYFLERFAAELHVEKPPLALDALELLQSCPWPGNVRQLQHCIQRAMIFTRGHPIQAATLSAALDPGGTARPGEPGILDEKTLAEFVGRYLNSYRGPRAHEHFLEKLERLLLAEALRQTHGNQTHAARLLGLPRPTLHAKMQKYRLPGPTEPNSR
jgi:nitrogen regulation protein NR(I)